MVVLRVGVIRAAIMCVLRVAIRVLRVLRVLRAAITCVLRVVMRVLRVLCVCYILMCVTCVTCSHSYVR